MPRTTKTTAKRGRPRVTNAGTRRSEKIVGNESPVEMKVAAKEFGPLKEHEDPRFRGLRTVIVGRDDPRGDMHVSPIGTYEGKGYHVVSEDPKYTGHSGHVLMGIDIDEWHRREDERLFEHNARFTDGYAPDLVSSRGEDDPMKFVRSANIMGQEKRSGVFNPNPRIPVHSQLKALSGH